VLFGISDLDLRFARGAVPLLSQRREPIPDFLHAESSERWVGCKSIGVVVVRTARQAGVALVPQQISQREQLVQALS